MFMAKKFLTMNGYDGLIHPYGSGCACGLDDLMNCGNASDCLGAYKTKDPEGTDCFVLEKPEENIRPVRCIYCKHCKETDINEWYCHARDVDGIDPYVDEPCCLFACDGVE
jgi:hypothetical protein